VKRYSCNNFGEIRYSTTTVMRPRWRQRTNFDFFVSFTDKNGQTLLITKRVKIKIIPWKLSSFTSRAVFQQLTGFKFYGSATDTINFVVFFRSLTGGDLVRTPLYCVKRVTKFIVTICRLRKRQWQVKGRRQIPEMTPENSTPSILFQVYYRWPQQHISSLIVAEMTPEILTGNH